MKALILNSGLGSRMGDITNTHPKCMTEVDKDETIVSRQISLLRDCGIKDIVMTTGYFDEVLREYCNSLYSDMNITYVINPKYRDTNYIYSIYCAKDELDDDIILIHGDLVFTKEILDKVINSNQSVMTVSSTLPLPEKDFKAVIDEDKIIKVGVEFFGDALACQPLYKVNKEDWLLWLSVIEKYVNEGKINCYAENAFNEIGYQTNFFPLDIKNMLCGEIDNLEDLKVMRKRLWRM